MWYHHAHMKTMPLSLLFVMAASVALSAVPPPDASVVFPAEEVKVTARDWQMQPFEPEDGKRVIKDLAIDELPDDNGNGLELGLEDALAPAPKAPKGKGVQTSRNSIGNKARKEDDHGEEDLEPPLKWPTEGDLYWGYFRFAGGAWWSTTLLMQEALGMQFEPPKTGMDHDQYSYNNIWLRSYEEIDASWKGRRVIFSMDRLENCDLMLYVNRKPVGPIYRTEGELDVTDALEFGAKNEFLLLLSANGYQIPPSPADTYTGRRKGGGYKPLGRRNFNLRGQRPRLVARPAMYISDVFADTSWRRKTLTVEIELTSAKPVADAILQAEVFDADGKVVKTLSHPFSAKAGTTTVRGDIPWDDPITWELGRGYLYTLRTSVKMKSGTFGHKDVRFGFREIWRDGRRIYMNGHEQKFRMCYNFGAGLPGAEFLSRIGYNVIQYAHNNRDVDPLYSEDLLYGLAEKGMGCAIATTQIFYNQRGGLVSNADIRADYERLLAKNLRRYRNIPSVVMCYMGVNINIQNWTQDALHLGSGASGQFDKLINELAASAHRTNPNALFYSHGDGINGDIATANLYLNWIPLQERVEWPSRWAVRGHFPFQAAEFGHPYQMTWYRDGHHDVVSELLAIYYGDEAYRQEPQSLRIRHGDFGLLYIRRMQHPLYWRFLDEFVWGVNRSWRTFGINGGIAWFNLDQGFGMPGWELDKIWNEYSPNYSDATFKKIGGVPDGRPDWAFPSWDIYQRGNKDFLGYIGGWPRHTDKRHAYAQGEQVEKQIVMLDDSFAPGAFSARWRAFGWDDAGKEQPIASGSVERLQLESNVPRLEKISFAAPQIQGGAQWPSKPRNARVEVEFLDAQDKTVASDSLDFEIHPAIQFPKKPQDSRVAVFDPRGITTKWLDEHGIADVRKLTSLDAAAIGDATHLVIGSYALESNDFAVASTAIEAGLKVLIMEQSAGAWAKFGFTAYDVAPRRLWLRDTSNEAFAGITDDNLHDWAGQPQVPPGAKTYEGQIIGHLAKGSGPRWTRNMAVASLVLRTPDVVGYIPQIEGEFDMNMSALLKLHRGKGSVQFCTLSLEGRTVSFPPATKDSPDDVRPVRDPACDAVACALLRDFLAPSAAANSRTVVPLGADAERLARECVCNVEGVEKVEDVKDVVPSSILLVGPGADTSWAEIRSKVASGARILVFANEKIAAEAGFTFSEPVTNYCASFSASNKALRGVGQNLLRWRSRMFVKPYAKVPAGFAKDADGLFASNADGGVIFTQIDPFQIERRFTVAGGKMPKPDEIETDEDAAERPAGGAGVTLEEVKTKEEIEKEKKAEFALGVKEPPEQWAKHLGHASMTIEHGYQFFSRLLTNLGAAPSQASVDAKGLYNLPFTTYDPYFFHYW